MAPVLDDALIKRLSSHQKPVKARANSADEEVIDIPTPAGKPRRGSRDMQIRRKGSRDTQIRRKGDTVQAPPSAPQSGRSSRQANVQLDEVPERPMDPATVVRMQAAASKRSNDLQNIFTSQHSDRCDQLRGRVDTLNSQASELRSRIASLERELQEATAERLKEAHVEPTGSTGMKVANHDVSSPESPNNKRRQTADAGAAGLDGFEEIEEGQNTAIGEDVNISFGPAASLYSEMDISPKAGGDPSRAAPENKKYQDEVLLPLLARRRAEARFKEASFIHENSITDMKAEMQEIERRTVKQVNWMKHVDKQVLELELTKARYQVRLDSSKKRVAMLGQHLSQAYDTIGRLVEDRLQVGNSGAKNDALVWYLHLLGVSDKDNAKSFIDNKDHLLSLNDRVIQVRGDRAKLDELLDQVRCTQLLAADILKHSDELAWLADLLQQLWNLVPVDWKDSVFKSVQKGLAAPLAMHPVNAIQALQGASFHVDSAMRSYLRAVTEYVDSANNQTRRKTPAGLHGLGGGAARPNDLDEEVTTDDWPVQPLEMGRSKTCPTSRGSAHNEMRTASPTSLTPHAAEMKNLMRASLQESVTQADRMALQQSVNALRRSDTGSHSLMQN